MKSYAGVGSRFIPTEINHQMEIIGAILASLGVVLRSGAANGSDAAFERGCDMRSGSKEIFLPWRNFNEHKSSLYHIPDKAYDIAMQYFPKDRDWSKIKDTTKRFMARDCQQVSGKNLDDFVDFVVCYTLDGSEHDNDRTNMTGGTGQAISYASLNGIPVFNLYHNGRFDDVIAFIEETYT